MEVYAVLDYDFLCGHSCLRCCLCDGHAVPELEDLLACSDCVSFCGGFRGLFGWEYCWGGVSFSFFHFFHFLPIY